MQKTVTIALFIFTANTAVSKTNDTTNKPQFDKNLCLLTGINYGKQLSIDLGVSVSKSGSVGYHRFASAYFLGTEFHFVDKPVIGPKIGGWFAGGAAAMAIGANLIYYTDFSSESLVFRPEIGLRYNQFKLTYGYNAKLTNTSFNRISKSVFSFTYCFKLKKLVNG